jgi:hypothetical protein
MPEKKRFKYFAILVANTVIFRRTVSSLQRVRSVLYSRLNAEFRLEQVTYTGGRVMGSMPYKQWLEHGGQALRLNSCTLVTRERFRALDPYMQKEITR